MRQINKLNRTRFEKLMRQMLLRHFGTESGIVQTRFGPLALRGFNADNMYNLFTCFEDPSKLPGEQIPYHFRTPETHQTYSKGGAIGGQSFNGYSGKWNFHFMREEKPEDVIKTIEWCFRHLVAEQSAVV